jgi:hypothetical protein
MEVKPKFRRTLMLLKFKQQKLHFYEYSNEDRQHNMDSRRPWRKNMNPNSTKLTINRLPRFDLQYKRKRMWRSLSN